jgi:hypothetical protein
VEFRIRIVGIFGARNGTSERWREAVHTDRRPRLGSRIQPGRFAYLIRAKKLPCVRDAVPLVRLEAGVVV